MLGDVKTVSLTTNSPYLKQEPFKQQWNRVLDKRPSVAVERREEAVAKEYRSLARDCDEGPGCPRAGAPSLGGRSGPRGTDDRQAEEPVAAEAGLFSAATHRGRAPLQAVQRQRVRRLGIESE